MTKTLSSYVPHRVSTTQHIRIRDDVPYQLRHWATKENTVLDAPPLLLLHGWMDVGASFQQCVDGLNSGREVIALDWRGFGGSRGSRPADSHWFYDYYADLDAIIDHISPNAPIDLLGHSMGGNIAMIYAGTCPERVRRLINVEGFGLPRTQPDEAPRKLARWLSELKTPVSIRTFTDIQEVADHFKKRSPHIDSEFALWLARQWVVQKEDGRWHVCADPSHKRVNPILYRCDEVLASWENIQAQVLWVEGDKADEMSLKGNRYSRQEFEERLDKVESIKRIRFSNCGHMVHLDKPEALAQAIENFLVTLPSV